MENQENSKTNENNQVQPNPLAVPGAIILAGLLIAGAVIYSGNGSSVNYGKVNDYKEVVIDSDSNFAKCLDSGKYNARIENDLKNAAATGGRGTPWSIVVSKSGKKYPINGALPFAQVDTIIKQALADDAAYTYDAALDNMDPITKNDHILGNTNAPVKIVEYSDTECPFCKRFHATVQQVMAKYGKSGELAWVYRHFPLESLHAKAKIEAHATECANELGGNTKFWEYLDRMMEITPSNDGLSTNALHEIAAYVGLK